MASFAGSSIVGIIISLLAIGILIYNLLYVSALRKQLESKDLQSIDGLSATGATILFWLDIALVVILGLYLLYNIFVIFTTHDDRSQLRDALVRSRSGAAAPLYATRPQVQ